MNKKEILNFLPHTNSSILLDSTSELHADGISFSAFANMTGTENFFENHFKDEVIMPAKDLLEGMAQSAGILFHLMTQDNPEKYGTTELRYLVGADKLRFKSKVVPGKTLLYKVTYLKSSRNLSKFNCTATVEGKVVAKAVLLISS